MPSQNEVAAQAAALRELPTGTTRPDPNDRWNKFTKSPRGDWTEMSSTPSRFTSHELALMGVTA